jgi:hypothetical protein
MIGSSPLRFQTSKNNANTEYYVVYYVNEISLALLRGEAAKKIVNADH